MIDSLLTTVALTVLTAVAVAMYLLPVLVGWFRHVPDIGSVAVINLLLGWTLVGWVVALALALRTVHSAPVIQVVQNLSPAPPARQQPFRLPPAGWSGPPGPPPSRPAPPPLDLPARRSGPAGPAERR